MSVVRSLSSGANFKFAVVGGQLVVQDKDSVSGRTYTLPSLAASITLTGALTFAGVVTYNGAAEYTDNLYHNGDVSTSTVGFWGNEQTGRPSSVGQTAGFTAGVGTAVLSDSTFTGGSGTKAYTVGDVVKHLKALGLLAAS